MPLILPGNTAPNIDFTTPQLPEDVRNPLGSLAKSLGAIAEAQRKRKLDELSIRERQAKMKAEEEERMREDTFRRSVQNLDMAAAPTFEPGDINPLSPIPAVPTMRPTPTLTEPQRLDKLGDLATRYLDPMKAMNFQSQLEQRRGQMDQRAAQLKAKQTEAIANLSKKLGGMGAVKQLIKRVPATAANLGLTQTDIDALPDPVPPRYEVRDVGVPGIKLLEVYNADGQMTSQKPIREDVVNSIGEGLARAIQTGDIASKEKYEAELDRQAMIANLFAQQRAINVNNARPRYDDIRTPTGEVPGVWRDGVFYPGVVAPGGAPAPAPAPQPAPTQPPPLNVPEPMRPPAAAPLPNVPTITVEPGAASIPSRLDVMPPNVATSAHLFSDSAPGGLKPGQPIVQPPKAPSMGNFKDLEMGREIQNTFLKEPIVTTVKSFQAAYTPVRALAQSMLSNPQDISGNMAKAETFITAFSKMTDPTTGVREGEFDRVAKAAKMLGDYAVQLRQFINSGGSVRLTPRQVEEMYGAAEVINQAHMNAFNDAKQRFLQGNKFYIDQINGARQMKGLQPIPDEAFTAIDYAPATQSRPLTLDDVNKYLGE